jgi:N-acyl-D-aspartate/D-glutamate deacylase
MPGFIDLHTHYDAEVEIAPSLSESLRHGVTTVVVGSCSLSLALGTPEDLADMFCRVEAIPYHVVRPLLEEKKRWETLPEYLEHLDSLALGPNIASFVGHSAIRAHVMGLERSLSRQRPSEDELRRMEDLLDEGLDAGYLGLSIMTLKWDKMGGSRELRSRPLPSTYARWSEYRRLTRHVRAHGRVFQGVPDVTTKVNVLLFLFESLGIVPWRKPLKTTIISLMDIRANRSIWWLVGSISRLFNRLGADFRWQALPEVFDLWADGIDLVVFEEFGAGTAALHLQDAAARADLLRDPAYRRRFRKEWTSRFLPRAFHRDFNHSEILACPEAALVGKSFAAVAAERGEHVVDVFLDLVARHGERLRWYTVMGNDRPGPLQSIVSHPDVLIGFSDAGAHLRQMAHYNFPLRMLRLVKDAAPSFMSVERAVERLTGEIGGWLGIDAGVLDEGRRADVVVIDPAGIDGSVDDAEEAEIEGFDGFRRLVRRNDRAVSAVLVNGRLAVEGGQVLPEVGRERGFGQVLRAGP